MNVAHLVKMANQIGAFYESTADRDAGAAAVANHLARFWEPRMRRALIEHVAATDGGDLTPIVAAAARRLTLPDDAPLAR